MSSKLFWKARGSLLSVLLLGLAPARLLQTFVPSSPARACSLRRPIPAHHDAAAVPTSTTRNPSRGVGPPDWLVAVGKQGGGGGYRGWQEKG